VLSAELGDERLDDDVFRGGCLVEIKFMDKDISFLLFEF